MDGQGHDPLSSSPSGDDSGAVRFECPRCGMILEAPAGLAGTEGPCPGCRAAIQAPAAPRRIEIKPRPVKRKASFAACEKPMVPPGLTAPPGTEGGCPPEGMAPPRWSVLPPGDGTGAAPGAMASGGDTASSGRGARPFRPRRAISPATGTSARYDEQKARDGMLKVVLAVLVTLGVVAAVVTVVKHGVDNALGEPSRETPVPRPGTSGKGAPGRAGND